METSERTYTGPRGPNDEAPPANIKPPISGGMFIALGLAAVALIMAFIAIWMAAGTESKVDSVGNRVNTLAQYDKDFSKQVIDKFDWVAVKLAGQATQIADLGTAVGKLQTKAEQSLVDKLSEEIKGKASDIRVTGLASTLMLKADANAVRRIARKVNKLNTRLNAVEELLLPKAAAPLPPSQPAKPAAPVPAAPLPPPPAKK